MPLRVNFYALYSELGRCLFIRLLITSDVESNDQSTSNALFYDIGNKFRLLY